MIPKIIHYCWFGENPLPYDVKKCIKSWKKMCPDYEIIRWDETNFDINCHPFVKAAYEARAWAFVSDYARLKVIYDNGGIYLDTDVELIKSLNDLLEYECYIGVQQLGHLCTTGLGFGATKSNSVVLEMLKKYDDVSFDYSRQLEFACPYLNNEVFKSLGYEYSENEIINLDGILILPPKFLDPVAPGKDQKYLLCDETISIHHYSASWMDGKTRIRRKIISFIGLNRVNKIKKWIQ